MVGAGNGVLLDYRASSRPDRDCRRHSARFTQGPDLASALEVLLVDLHVVGALGLGDGEKLGDVLGAAVAEPYGPRIVGQVELDLELGPIPAGLRGIVVGVRA